MQYYTYCNVHLYPVFRHADIVPVRGSIGIYYYYYLYLCSVVQTLKISVTALQPQ